MTTTLVLTWLLPASHAFCGTYVGPAGAGLYNSTSQVVLVRNGNQTTLTLASDFSGDLEEFALIIPIPQVLGEGDVEVIDPDVINRVDTYSAPRLVRYTCSDFTDPGYSYSVDTGDSGLDGTDSETAGSAKIEAQFSAGEYDITVLSAAESEGLLGWLQANGYDVPEESAEVLQDYIDSGSYFLAAKVDPADLPDGQVWLRPLQLKYSNPGLSLPIRLGTLNSPGVQDLIVYVLNDEADGAAGITNYPEQEVEHECMVDLADGGDGTDFAEFWEEAFEAPRVDRPGAQWTREYAWSPAWCDPCAGDPLDDEDVQTLGFDGTAWDAFLTRLHLRYEPSEANKDLVIYLSGDAARTQIRYILYDPALEDRYPLCVTGWADDPGSCDGEDPDDDGTNSDDDDDGQDEDNGRFGCGAPVTPGMIPALLALWALMGRRRD